MLLPGFLLLVLTLWPWWDKSPAAATGVWLHASRRRQVWVFLAVCLVILVFTLIGTFLRGPYWHFYWPWEPWSEVPGRI